MTTYIKPEPDSWNSVCIIELKSKKQNKKPQKSYTGIHPSTTEWAGIKADILGVVVTSKCITPLRTWTGAGDILLQRPQRSGAELDFQISECITLTSLHTFIHKPSSILLQHPQSSPCPSKATVSYKWSMCSPHLICAVCCLSDKSLKFTDHRTQAVGALDFILSFLTDYVFVSILQVWNMLSNNSHALKFLKWVNWEERRAQGKSLPSPSGNITYLRGSWRMLELAKYSEKTKSYATEWKTFSRTKSKLNLNLIWFD